MVYRASTLAIGTLLSVTLRSRVRAIGAAFAAWLLFVYVSDLGSIGLAIARGLAPAQLFALALLNPVEQARVAGTLALTDRLEVLGPVGIFALDHLGRDRSVGAAPQSARVDSAGAAPRRSADLQKGGALVKRILAIGLPALAVIGVIVFWPRATRGRKPLQLGRDACARCRMQLSTPRLRRGGARPQGPAHHLRRRRLPASGHVGAPRRSRRRGSRTTTRGASVPITKAAFVRASRVATPMNYGVLAFSDEAGARRFAAAEGGEVATLEQLLNDKERFTRPHARCDQAAGSGRCTDKDSRAGKPLYIRECAGCHGERGDGAGPAAAFLDPEAARLHQEAVQAAHHRRTGARHRRRAPHHRARHPRLGDAVVRLPHARRAEQDRRLRARRRRRARRAGACGRSIPARRHPRRRNRSSAARRSTRRCSAALATARSAAATDPPPPALHDDDGVAIKVRDFTGRVSSAAAASARISTTASSPAWTGRRCPPSATSIQGADRWALVDYVLSLRVAPAAAERPSDPILAGRQVAEKFSCRGCHVLDDGKGGDVGPDLRVSGQKLGSDWVRTFLKDPRDYGKIYHVAPAAHAASSRSPTTRSTCWRTISPPWASGRTRRSWHPIRRKFPQAKLDLGKNILLLRCVQCHTLGKVIVVPLATQQGPDLARVAPRVDYEWARHWIMDSRKIDPKTRMTDPGITPEQVDAVRMFVWKTSIENQPTKTAAAAP